MTTKITLILPDIHHDWEVAEEIIANVKHDEVLFLGDYFDDFDDTPEMVKATCKWLCGSVSKSNRIHLFGNHDVHYAFSYRNMKCAGYTQWKDFIIQDLVSRDVWNKLEWYYILDNTWFVSHAGLHELNLPEEIRKLHEDRPQFLKAIGEYLNESIYTALRCAANNQPFWIFNAGRARGGGQRVGGIVWCDYEREFHPIKGLNQILGHTPQSLGFPKWCLMNDGKITFPSFDSHIPSQETILDPNASVNIDLDVYKKMHYAIWDGKTLQVKNTYH